MIQLNYRDSKPIYEQIKDGFRKLIITNSLSANEKLPSVRELASGLDQPQYDSESVSRSGERGIYIHGCREGNVCGGAQGNPEYETA